MSRRRFFDTERRRFRSGRYTGQPLSAVPDGYLLWVLDNIVDLCPMSAAILRTELAFREMRAESERQYQQQQRQAPNFATAPRLKPEQVPVALELIAAGRRALARQHHPDVGGDLERMRAINCTADDLESGLRALAGGAGR